MKIGTIKWFRDDGTGYIVYEGKSILVDITALNNCDSLDKGDLVHFESLTVLDKEIATQVIKL